MVTQGFATSRLERMHEVLSGHIQRKDMPGLVALLSHHDDVHIETLGTPSFESQSPMTRDTIFRIASISKVVTAVAAMILVEECKMRLDDSIERWLPELANRRVLKSITSQHDDTVPAKRAITVRDLLTFRMGLGSVMAMPDTYPVQKLIREKQIGGDSMPLPAKQPTTEQWLRNLSEIPWIAQPGERWMYHVSCDVLGVLIARVSGQSLWARLLRRAASFFDPLGMKDTGFDVPAEKLGRFTSCYSMNQQTNKLDVFDGIDNSAWIGRPPFESAGGGLVSTIDDYFAFSRMMLNKGRLGREQILRATVELMTSRSGAAGISRRLGDFLRRISQLGPWFFRRYIAQGDLSLPRPIRLGRRDGNIRLHRSGQRCDRNSVHPTHDGLAAPPQAFTDFWDHCVRVIE